MDKKEYKREYPRRWWNPSLVDFCEADPDKTLISFAWSCYWRLTIVMTALYIAALVVAGLLAFILD